MSNVNFLIADVQTYFVSGTMITSHKGVQQKSNLSSFQSLAPKLVCIKFALITSFPARTTPLNHSSTPADPPCLGYLFPCE